VFRGKHGPDDFELPACAECNRAMALSEQVTAFYIRSTDHIYDQLDQTDPRHRQQCSGGFALAGPQSAASVLYALYRAGRWRANSQHP